MHAAITVAAGRDLLTGISNAITAKAIVLLSYLGFAPVRAGHLPWVAIMVWLLFITAFSPIQLLLGLPLYIAIFPLTVVFKLVFWKTLKDAEANPVASAAPAPAHGLRTISRHFLFSSLAGSMVSSLWRFVIMGA